MLWKYLKLLFVKVQNSKHKGLFINYIRVVKGGEVIQFLHDLILDTVLNLYDYFVITFSYNN